MSPQHGYWGLEQDNMIETAHSYDESTKLPVYSLYSETRTPSHGIMQKIDTLIIDLQIVGCRVYTFKATIAACLRAAKSTNCKIVILDRPNPLGGVFLEGRCLDSNIQSFVGEFPLPMRHGLSVAELALFFNQSIQADLSVIKMQNWDPHQLWHEFNHNWLATSPNLPTINSLVVYPGFVLFEGTNISEGRGTTLPFQLIGAPFIKDPEQLLKRVYDYCPTIHGLYLRPTFFRPTFNKHKDKVCGGLQVHVVNPLIASSFLISIAIIKAFHDFSSQTIWTQPPYEYETKIPPINLLIGAHNTKEKITSYEHKDSFWTAGLSDYIHNVKKIILYDRNMQIIH